MLRLASILYAIIATTLAGIGIIAVLVAGYDTDSGLFGDCTSVDLTQAQAFTNARIVASNSRGFSACSQCPAPDSLANRALGNRARMAGL